MSNYVIGDLQGCYEEFKELLNKISFDPEKDRLWLCGDLINRGPDSLCCLSFLYSIKESCHIVLGNHDLHLLAVAHGSRDLGKKDTFSDILESPDLDILLDWVKELPFHYIKEVKTDQGNIEFIMTHAGIPPMWNKADLIKNSNELSQALKGEESRRFLKNMYGNKPNLLTDCRNKEERLRLNVNYLTRMRYIYPNGALDLKYKGVVKEAPKNLMPWFNLNPKIIDRNTHLLFGHWAALNGITGVPKITALDTGCVWGNKLTAMRLEDYRVFSCDKLN